MKLGQKLTEEQKRRAHKTRMKWLARKRIEVPGYGSKRWIEERKIEAERIANKEELGKYKLPKSETFKVIKALEEQGEDNQAGKLLKQYLKYNSL